MGFEWAYRSSEPPPWDIGRPQPMLVRLAEEGAISGSVIDLGCGTGENALYLASRGLDVTGLDAAPTAIARARQKAADRSLPARFVVADALALETFGRTFDTAFDSGLFHVFSDSERVTFEHGLRRLLRPGGRYFMLCFSDEQPGTAGPRRVSQAEIRATFSQGWRVDSIVAERFTTLDRADSPVAPRAWLASLARLPDPAPGGAVPRVDVGPAADRNASRTALGAARLRAAHLLLDEPPLILNDPLAAQLLDPEAESAILLNAERFRTPVSRAIRCDVVVRSRYAEDRLEEAFGRGTRQFVVLGAGLDTFAYRQPAWASKLKIFEVDHSASQRDKRDRLARAGIPEPSNVAYAPADLEADDLLPLLQSAGLDPARPAFVACLGVLIYLSKQGVDRIVALTAALAPGSQFVFTFSRPDVSSGSTPRPGSVAAGLAAIGEPWQTRFEPEAFAAELRAAGFGSVRLLFPDDVTRLYLQDRTDGLRPASRSVLAEATV